MRTQRSKKKDHDNMILTKATIGTRNKRSAARLARRIKRKHPYLDVHVRKGKKVVVKQLVSDTECFWFNQYFIL